MYKVGHVEKVESKVKVTGHADFQKFKKVTVTGHALRARPVTSHGHDFESWSPITQEKS